MFTRRTATVTMSAPDASCARAMTACDGYLPVPMIRRDWNVRPAMTNGESVIQQISNPKPQAPRIQSPRIQIPEIINHQSSFIDDSPSADEVDDLHSIAVLDHDLLEALAFDDGEVVLDRHAPRVDVELLEQRDE